MNDELIKGNQQHNPDNAANAANNAGGQSQQERIVNSVIAAPTQNNPTRQTNPAEQKPHKPVGIRIWRSLWRRRKWRNIRKSDRPPINWVEKSTLAVAFLVFVITSIQAMIYYWQADLMQKQIVQAQSANRRQLVIAAESNQITREALESVQRAFITFKGVDTNGRNLNPPNGSHAWIFYPGVENSGTTPAVAAISYVTAKTLPSGPTEQQFIGPKTDHHVTVQYTVGPKALQRLGPLYPKDIEMFGRYRQLWQPRIHPAIDRRIGY